MESNTVVLWLIAALQILSIVCQYIIKLYVSNKNKNSTLDTKAIVDSLIKTPTSVTTGEEGSSSTAAITSAAEFSAMIENVISALTSLKGTLVKN